MWEQNELFEAIAINPFIPRAYYVRGFARKKLNKFTEAIQDFNKALEFSPENADFIANRMEAKERNKDYDSAIEDLNLYRKLKPNSQDIDYEIGRIKLEKMTPLEP